MSESRPMNKVLVWLVTIALVTVAMELWAAFLHRFVWHTFLWNMHRSHHRGRGDIAQTHTQSSWELNDVFGLLHAPPAIALILYGCLGPVGLAREICFGVGLGMSVFGASYALVHDGLSHRRLPVKWLGRSRYLRRVAAAHRVHHRLGATPFGLFFGPWHLRRAVEAGALPTPRRGEAMREALPH